ncbi:hypothetical protein [Burkholderia cepacia]|uniref:hypothetical protein n=1 Tax=Burkholderia cepacia TaxID=292 RepID=UPI0012D8CE3A|nr:hypothetical protein [Burkholderia cepacia]
MTLNRSGSRIVMVIVPVAFIAGAPKGAGDQPTGQNTTFLFSGNATSELGTYTQTADNDDYVNYDLREVPRRSLAHLMPA